MNHPTGSGPMSLREDLELARARSLPHRLGYPCAVASSVVGPKASRPTPKGNAMARQVYGVCSVSDSTVFARSVFGLTA